MDLLIFIVVLIGIFALVYVGYRLWLWLLSKRMTEQIEALELEQIRTQAQIIDLREAVEYEVRHILGARNIPMSQFKQRYKEIRKDRPVYLVDDSGLIAPRAARHLKRNGYQTIYMLKDGMSSWGGKVKVKK